MTEIGRVLDRVRPAPAATGERPAEAEAAAAQSRQRPAEAEAPAVDGRRARGDKTRHTILAHAAQIASTEGLDGLSLGRLAEDLGMSKSGLFAHFGSKEELQVKTLRAARRIFYDHAVQPTLDVPEGLERLTALVESKLEYLAGDYFAGGCPFISAAAQFQGRPGPIRDLVVETVGSWRALLVAQARVACERGELKPDVDPQQLAWQLYAYELAFNWDWRLNESPTALERAQAAVRARLCAAATAKGRRLLRA